MRRLCSSSAQARKYVDWPTNARRSGPPSGGVGVRRMRRGSSHRRRIGYAADAMTSWEARVTRGTAPARPRRRRAALRASSPRSSARPRCGSTSAAARAWPPAPRWAAPRPRCARDPRRPRRRALGRGAARAAAPTSARRSWPTSRPPRAPPRCATRSRPARRDPASSPASTCCTTSRTSSPLVDLLVELGARATVVLSVPDDASGAIETRTGAARGRRVRPRSCAACCPPARSARAGRARAPRRSRRRRRFERAAGQRRRPRRPARPSHYLLAFGADAARLAPASLARVADLEAERADARRRTSELAFLRPAGALEEPEPARRRCLRVAFLVHGPGAVRRGRRRRRARLAAARATTASTPVLVLARPDRSSRRWTPRAASATCRCSSSRRRATSAGRRGRDVVGDDVFVLHDLPAERYAYFVQSMEDRFYAPERPGARPRR